MIAQSCPRCGSKRVRLGYRHTPLWKKIFGRYYLLCNSCNWEFIGFALPGTVESHSQRRKRKKRPESEKTENQETNQMLNDSENSATEMKKSEPKAIISEDKKRIKVRKRYKVRLKD